MVSFHAADYVVGIFVLSVPLVIGVVFAWKDKSKLTREEYLVGGRKMSMLPVALSIFITFQSAISLIGIPAEVYFYGSKYFIVSIGVTIGYIFGMYTFVPLMYPLRLTSIYDYLLMRYRSNAVRLLSTILGMLTTSFYMAVALLSPALALQTSAGVPFWLSVAVVGSIGTLYTALGGIKSVIWTDAFQTVIVFVGITVIIVKGVTEVGGVTEIWSIAEAGGRTQIGQLLPDPRERHTIIGVIIGGFILCQLNNFNQSAVQRVCSMKSLKMAKRSFLLNAPMSVIYYAVLVIVGNTVYAYFTHVKCGPYQADIIQNRNQITPYFVLETMGDLYGMAGLYVSTLCCGSLSTISSGINALAANTVEDILKRPLRNVSEGMATVVTKFFALLHGFLIIAIAYVMKSLQGPVNQIAITIINGFGSPVLGIFLVGALVPWVNQYGAFFGALIAILFNIWFSISCIYFGSVSPPLNPVQVDMCFHSNSSNNEHYSVLYSNFSKDANVLRVNEHVNIFPNTSSTTSSLKDPLERPYGFFMFDISYEWHGFMGTLVSMSLALIISAFTRSLSSGKGTLDSHLIFPFLRKCWGLSASDTRHFKLVPKDIDVFVEPSTKMENNESKKPIAKLSTNQVA